MAEDCKFTNVICFEKSKYLINHNGWKLGGYVHNLEFVLSLLDVVRAVSGLNWCVKGRVSRM